MIVCKQCGVELDEQMQVCPLCETSVMDGGRVNKKFSADVRDEKLKPTLLKRVLWQIACVLLLSAIVATLIIDLSRLGYVTWSIYPVTISLILFSYSSLIVLWRAKPVIQLLAAWLVSGALLIAVKLFTGDDWPIRLALPILCGVNVICMLLISILSRLKVKGVNVLAIMFVAIAVLCVLIEGVLSLYLKDQMVLNWSVIVAACLLPVTAAVVYIHLRTRNNKDLQKIFHT